MSRGHGAIQRAAMEVLDQNGSLSVLELAWACYDVQPDATGFIAITDAQRAAMARALQGLQRQGLAFAVHRTSRGGYLWMRRENAIRHVERVASTFGPPAPREYSPALMAAWRASRADRAA